MGRKRGVYYVNPEDLRDEIQSYQDTGVMSDELGVMIMNIAQRFTNYFKFVRYPQHVKEHFVGEATVRIIEQIDMIDLSHPKCNPFSYLTTLCSNKFISEAMLYYKYKNFKEALTDMFFDEIEGQEGVQFNRNTDEDFYK